ncbi:hypothetical protein BDZ89DRAFT_379895 [Hymenopellis radicata]|nr:hypothetical protein BDZ89DRAFT_379895 [Hymenopellis radicata]
MYRHFASRPHRKSPSVLLAAAASTIGLVKIPTTSAPLALTPKRTSFPSGNHKKLEVVLAVVADAIRVLEKVADSVPFLSVATGITLMIIDKLLAINDNREECSATAQRIAQVFLAIAKTFRHVNQNDIPPVTLDSIRDLQSRLNEFLGDVEEIAAASERKRYFLPERIKSDLRDLNSKIDDSLRLSQLSSTFAIQAQTERLSCTAQIADANAPGIPEVKDPSSPVHTIPITPSR